jgi:serine/threonine-protein kinase
MSTVYRAYDQRLERQVAIKLLHGDIAADEAQLERFRREARAVALLSHPHVVTVIDAGEDGGRPYIVFEHVQGETLKERIRRCGRLPVEEATAYAIEIARALGAAHARGIVHRDVKPQNVLIDEEGSAKVTDFGIARTLDADGLTASGRVLGTTDYVSPEQALGHPVTGQSDLYSLGVVLYEMLTGEVPFHGESQVAVAMKHVREALPDVQSQRPEVSATLAAVVDRATAKELDRRYASDAELIADLEEALAVETARSGSAPGEVTTVLRTLPPSTRRRVPLRLRRPSLVLPALLVLAIGAAAVAIALAGSAQRGTGGGTGYVTPPGEQVVSLGQRSAHDYDPYGDQQEHPDQASFAVDRRPSTAWTTEHYVNGELGKPGVGIYVDAKPRVAARSIEITTPTRGLSVAIYGATSGPPASIQGWTQLASAASISSQQRLTLATNGASFRYYLVWITKLPPGSERAEISEIRLFEKVAA